MFDFLKSKVHAIDYWHTPVDDFKTSTQEFYTAVEVELKRREVPGLEISRVNFHESSVISAKREYLRLTRERLVFDICAAPFGTSFFFSCRFAEKPPPVAPIAIIVLIVLLCILEQLFAKIFGLISGLFFLLLLIVLGIWFLRNLALCGMSQIEEVVLQNPLFGPLFERYIRRESYYRTDTRLMYLNTVNTVVKTLIEETTAAKGVKLLKQFRKVPPVGQLYHETPIRLTERVHPTPG